MVWVAAERALPVVTLANPTQPDPVTGYSEIEPVPPDSPVLGRFTLPFVSMVGSHQGCGCGYNSEDLNLQGFSTLDEVADLLDALNTEDRADFHAEQGSRQRLRDLVDEARRYGRVEVFGCWAGGEGDVAVSVKRVDPEYFTHHLSPIEDGVLYRVDGSEPG